ncbi:hypothetical protein MNV49_002223 [Pseudohyphozyma bogoriensis]|nr:hypothetical protein MNV49_002223 [Pseudohyphozyma bogoriensis]
MGRSPLASSSNARGAQQGGPSGKEAIRWDDASESDSDDSIVIVTDPFKVTPTKASPTKLLTSERKQAKQPQTPTRAGESLRKEYDDLTIRSSPRSLPTPPCSRSSQPDLLDLTFDTDTDIMADSDSESELEFLPYSRDDASTSNSVTGADTDDDFSTSFPPQKKSSFLQAPPSPLSLSSIDTELELSSSEDSEVETVEPLAGRRETLVPVGTASTSKGSRKKLVSTGTNDSRKGKQSRAEAKATASPGKRGALPIASPSKRQRLEPYVRAPNFRAHSGHVESDLPRLLDETLIDPSSKDKPERTITSFTLVDSKRRHRSFLEILDNCGRFALIGKVGARNTSLEGEDAQPVWATIGKIQALHACDKWEAWVESEEAWYLLLEPAKEYDATFEEARRYENLYMAMRAYGLGGRKGLDRFAGELSSIELDPPEKFRIAEPLNEEDVESFKAELLADLRVLQRKEKEIHQNVPDPSRPTQLTRTVYSICAPHFPNFKQCLTSIDEVEALQDAETRRKWGQELEAKLDKMRQRHQESDHHPELLDHNDEEGHYDALRIGCDIYRVGDTVFIANDGNELWIARAVYFFERAKQPWIHLQWFDAGAKVFESPVSPPGQLFLRDMCEKQHAETIMGKAYVRRLEPGEPTPLTGLYYACVRDAETSTFTDASTLEQDHPTLLCDAHNHRGCQVCERRLVDDLLNIPRWIDDDNKTPTFLHQELPYHLGDDVLVFVEKKGVFEVGRIVSIDGYTKMAAKLKKSKPVLGEKSKVTVVYYRRLVDLRPDEPRLDDRELVLTNSREDFDLTYLFGRCLVTHHSEISNMTLYRKRGRRFFVRYRWSPAVPAKTVSKIVFDPEVDVLEDLWRNEHIQSECRTCRASRKEEEGFERDQPRMTAIDLFAGGGEGFKQAGVKTLVAVESNSEAARVYAHNHPTVKVVQKDINLVVEELDRARHGAGATDLPEEVDFVYGSPPCCSHSLANGRKKGDDPRTSLALTFFAIVELLNPKYFCMENVPLAMHAKLADGRNGGVLDLWLQVALELGYQVQFGVLPADSYGVPQTRTRFFMVGTKRGLSPMELPKAWTVSDTAVHNITHYVDGEATLHKSSIFYQDGAAPHRPPRFSDITSDLPAFGYLNDRKHAPSLSPALLDPPADGILRPPVRLAPFDELHLVKFEKYDVGPLTPYQEQMRYRPPRCRFGTDSDDDEDVEEEAALTCHHVAKCTKSIVAERICHIPVDGDHRTLPKALALDRTGTGAVKKKNFYARIGYGKCSPTLICSVNVHGGSHGACLHSHQNRLISVREAARTQGFPDYYNFAPPHGQPIDVKDQYKIIGNAVPPPLAYAIGLELQKSVFKSRSQEREE